jgi:hypothetical protein
MGGVLCVLFRTGTIVEATKLFLPRNSIRIVGDEAGSLGDGGRVGAVRVGAVEEEGEAAVTGLDGVRAP